MPAANRPGSWLQDRARRPYATLVLDRLTLLRLSSGSGQRLTLSQSPGRSSVMPCRSQRAARKMRRLARSQPADKRERPRQRDYSLIATTLVAGGNQRASEEGFNTVVQGRAVSQYCIIQIQYCDAAATMLLPVNKLYGVKGKINCRGIGKSSRHAKRPRPNAQPRPKRRAPRSGRRTRAASPGMLIDT